MRHPPAAVDLLMETGDHDATGEDISGEEAACKNNT
jgi:hypothetical protein